MTLLPEHASWYLPKNFIPESNSEPVCPSFQIIEICAQLSDFRVDNDHFCGILLEGLKPVSYEATCMKVRNKLAKMYTFASEKRNLPDLKEMEKIFADKSRSTSGKIFSAWRWTEKANESVKQEEIIATWRKQIWEITCINSKSENPHFRQIEKPEDLPTKEVLTKVGYFLDALKNITDHPGGPNMFDALIDYNPFKTPANCPEAPDRL